jgi:hypothetical protein
MSVVLAAPKYSFVQFTTVEPLLCVDDVNLCLPVNSPTDIKFQVRVTVSGEDLTWFNVPYNDGPVSKVQTIQAGICFDCEPTVVFPTNFFSFSADWRKIEDGEGQDVWIGNFSSYSSAYFNTLPQGQCFKLCFYRVETVVGSNTVLGLTQPIITCTDTCFYKISDVCYTSLVTYGNNEDNYGFIYTDANGDPNWTNRIRLPFYLRSMQMPSEERSYTKSNGEKVKLFERIEEEYELVTDWMKKEHHRSMKVMLGHDTLNITNSNVGIVSNNDFICREGYEIQWQDPDMITATATTKVVRADALTLNNHNCN